MRKALFVFDSSVDPAQLASFCLQTGVDSPILHPGFFQNDSFSETLRRNGLKIWLNLPVFFDEKYLAENPESYSITSKGKRAIHSWLHMVCPSQYKFLHGKCQEFAEMLRRNHPDYISYDFIRFYVFWEKVELHDPPDAIEHGCYCPECRRRFAQFSGEQLSIHDGIVEMKQRSALAHWKRTVIENTVRSLNAVVEETAKGTPVYIKTLPWTTSDLENGLYWIAGQDPAALGKLSDGIIPMAFTQILGQTPAWKKTLLDHTKAQTGKEVMSYIQFEPLIRPTTISNQQVEQEITAAIGEKRAGLIYFHYEQVVNNSQKREILNKYRQC